MTACNLDLANLKNLAALWKALGATQQVKSSSTLWISDNWPHKCWTDPSDPQTPISEDVQLGERLIFPVWGLGEASARETSFKNLGYEVNSEQTAMVLSAEARTHISATHNNIDLKQLVDADDAFLWSGICAEAFGYAIHPGPIRKLIQNDQASVFLAAVDGEAAGTAILYRTKHITGIHQVGVRPAFRGKGLARRMMESTIDHAFRSGTQHITLQASPAGKPLYDQLGFRDQFEIRNYKRGTNQ